MSSAIDRLRAAERIGRRLQISAASSDAAAMVRAWPAVAQAAYTAWSSLPTDVQIDDRVVERIALAAESLDHAADRHLWPGKGKASPALTQVAADFTEAANAARSDPAAPGDIVEAHRLILSTLWTMSRTIGTAARDCSFDLRYDPSMARLRRQRTSQLAGDTSRRFDVSEQLAANALFHRHNFRQPEPPAAALRQAIAGWDVEAHRALVHHRTTATLHAISFHQADTALALRHFMDTAHRDGVIDPWTHDRLAPVLALTETAWKDVHEVAGEFSFATVQLPIALHDAGRDLRAQLRSEPPHSPDGQREILGALSEHLASSLNLASVARDLVDEGELRAPARAVARAVSHRFPKLDKMVVNAEDLRRGVTVTLPGEARELLHWPTVCAVEAAAEALARSSALDTLYRTLPSVTPIEAKRSARPELRAPQLGASPAQVGPSR